jgi:hypothetical protein
VRTSHRDVAVLKVAPEGGVVSVAYRPVDRQPCEVAPAAVNSAVRRDDISAPYEFCSIDDLGRDENGADLALGRIDWTPGQALTLATESAAWGERVETYGYPSR